MSDPEPARRFEPGDDTLRFRAGLLCFGLLTAFSLLSWRLIYLQVDRHGHYLSLTETNHRRTDRIEAHRGSIFDSRGRILACDEPVRQVVFDLRFLSLTDGLAAALAGSEGVRPQDLRHTWDPAELRRRYIRRVSAILGPAVGMTAAEAEEKIQRRIESRRGGGLNGEIIFARDLSLADAERLKEQLLGQRLGEYRENRGSLGAVIFRDAWARRYPGPVSMPHIVGVFAEPEAKTVPGAPPPPPLPPRGVAGIEAQFESELAGVPGSRTMEVDGWGNEIPVYRGETIPPRNGRNIRITIDSGLQEIVTEALHEKGSDPEEVYVPDLKADQVIAVFFEPESMALRAIASWDRRRKPGDLDLHNPAVEFTYEPGSTVKIVTMAAALESGRFSAGSMLSISSSGSWMDSHLSRPIRDVHAYPQLTVEDVLVKSSNIGAYKLALAAGMKRFESMFRSVGFGEYTGLNLTGESRGLFPKRISSIDMMARMSFGYALSVTPAQMCAALGCILNDGVYRPLRLADAWVDDYGNVIEPILTGAGERQVMSARTAAAIRKAMVQVVERGTARRGRSELFEIGGKTGTADKVKAKGKGYGDLNVASFIGFVPADRPRLAGIVIVDSPRSGGSAFGGSLAAPIFRRIAERAMTYLEVPPQFTPAPAGAAAMRVIDTRGRAGVVR